MLIAKDIENQLNHTKYLKYYVNRYHVKNDQTIVLVMSNKIKDNENQKIFSDILKVQRDLNCRVMNYFLSDSAIGTPYNYTEYAN